MNRDAIEAVAQLAMDRQLKVSAAESLTGGRVQARLTAVSGASQWFQGGITVYQVAEKVKQLGVDAQHAVACNGVSERVAQQLASGACELFSADLAVATTGYAEADPAAGIPTACAWLAVAYRDPARANPDACFQLTSIFEETSGTRNEAQAHFADRAISLLHQVMTQIPPATPTM